MPAGFIARTDTGIIQISDQEIHFSLMDRGTLPSSGWAPETGTSSGGASEQIDLIISGFSTADAPMLAISSARGTWAEIISSTSSGITYRIYRRVTSESPVVDWYFFSKKSPPASTGAAMIIRNESNQIVFSSNYPPARVLGIFNQDGYSGAPITGKKLAHIPVKQRSTGFLSVTFAGIGSCTMGGSVPGYQHYRAEGSGRSSVYATVGDVGFGGYRGFQTGALPVFCSPSQQPQSNSYDSLTYESIIIDVTNL